MLVGFIGLNAVGYTGNVMSLGAIDFGIVVEGAVLTVEHAMTHGANIADRNRRRRRIMNAMADVAKPVVFSVVITILVFLPLVTLQDIEGKMFRPVVISLCFMLTGALSVALLASGATMGAEFLPRIFEGAFALDVVHAPSINVKQSIELSTMMEETLKETPEVETVVSRIGRPEGAVDSAGPESADCFVILKPKDKWRKGMT